MSAPFADPPPLPFDTADAPPAEAGRPMHRDAGGADRAAQALPMVLFDPRRPTPTCGMPARRACFPARLLPSQERGLDRQPAVPAARLDRRRAGARCRPTTSWTSTKDMAETVAPRKCRRPPRSPPAAGCPTTSLRVYSARICPHRLPGRPAMVSLRHLGRVHRRTRDCSRAAPSTCRRCFIAGKQDWGTYQRPGAFESDAVARPARRCSAAI